MVNLRRDEGWKLHQSSICSSRVEIFHLIWSKIWAVGAFFLDDCAPNLASKWAVWAVFDWFIYRFCMIWTILSGLSKQNAKKCLRFERFLSGLSRYKPLKNRSNLAQFLSGFLSKIWAVWAVFPKKNAQTAQTAQVFLENRSNRSYLKRFLSGISTRVSMIVQVFYVFNRLT